VRRIKHAFAFEWMRTAGIGPQSLRMVFGACPLLQHYLTIRIKYKYGNRPVQPAAVFVRLQLFL
jgi:hypothetical protein